LLCYPRESQFESESAAERAAVVPRGGRVLIHSPDLSNPIANPAVGFLHFQPQMNTDIHGFSKEGAWINALCLRFLSVSICVHPWFNSVNA
jgi:hypothetical protein